MSDTFKKVLATIL